uniref:Uncharacterized protein n=1 Tax=Streptomyces sp. NBC_00049 TaxID=2903617 RepID=A0AAU2JMG3_9ACTN
MTDGQLDFDTAWRAAPEAVRRSLALAHEALTAGGLAVGAVLTDAAERCCAGDATRRTRRGPRAGPRRGTVGRCGEHRRPTPR